MNVDFNPEKSHHRIDGFVNRYTPRSFKKGVLKWIWNRIWKGLPKPPSQAIQSTQPDLELIHSPSLEPRTTWIGHATVLFQIDGVNILTDPHFGKRASPIRFMGPKRHQPPGVLFNQLPPVHVVLLSHNHWDHLDQDSVQMLMNHHKNVRFFVPLGVQYWFKKHIKGSTIHGDHPNVIPLDWDDIYTIEGKNQPIDLHFLAVQHWSARYIKDRYQTLWGSWAIIHPTYRFWFSGDLAYSKDVIDIGVQMREFDLAAIAIGAYEPRWFMKESHVNPSEALKVMIDIHAKKAIAIHWGTFEGISDESLDQPPKDLQKALDDYAQQFYGLAPDFKVLQHGESIK
jgi:L-ascorbate metabolism protein UlaG (beta-lactamase superfamily)